MIDTSESGTTRRSLTLRELVTVAVCVAFPLIGMLRLGRPARALLYTAAVAAVFVVGQAARASDAWPGPIWTFPLLVITHMVAGFDCHRILSANAAKAIKAHNSWPALAGIALALLLGLNEAIQSYAAPFNIASASMAPTLIQGDRVLVMQLAARAKSSLQRGDVVLFRSPKRPDEVFVKRIVGLPGDHIKIDRQAVFINGQALTHEARPDARVSADAPRWLDAPRYVEHLGEFKHDILISDPSDGTNGEWRLESGQYFVMGDNRNFSNDSRFLGPVSSDDVIGRPYLIWWSAVVNGIKQTRWERIGTIIY